MLARTDVCPGGKTNAARCKLRFLGKNNSFTDNLATKGAGGGVLVTKLACGLVEVPACQPSCDDSAAVGISKQAFYECLGDGRGVTFSSSASPGTSPIASADASPGTSPDASPRASSASPLSPGLVAPAKGAGRSLLQDATAPGAGAGAAAPVALNQVGRMGYGMDLASAATTAHFTMVDNLTVEGLPTSGNASVAPGNFLPVALRLKDRWDEDVRGDISDASMIVQVRGWGGGRQGGG